LLAFFGARIARQPEPWRAEAIRVALSEWLGAKAAVSV